MKYVYMLAKLDITPHHNFNIRVGGIQKKKLEFVTKYMMMI